MFHGQIEWRAGKMQKFTLEGFARVHLKENGELIGNSGWVKNTVTDYGLDEGLGSVLIGDAGSKLIAYAALGEGSAPATNGTSLESEIDDAAASRDAVSKATVTSATGASVTARFYGTFSSSDNHLTATHDISNIGLFAISNVTAGTILSGVAYSSSNMNTNQDLEYTYEWRFGTA